MSTPDNTSNSQLAWHFVGNTLRDGRPVPKDGEVLRHEGPVVVCVSGLHASRRLIDALHYAPGNTICRVEVRGVVAEESDKLVARERVILWRVDGETVLREFARTCALELVHLWARDDTPGIDTVVEWLLTGDEALRAAARAAAWAAAWDAARDAARDAAWAAARAAASAAARDAAWAAARAAARAAAWDAAWDAADRHLVRMVEAVR